MSYRVEWSERADAELSAAWNATADWPPFLTAVQSAGFELESHPLDVGESRDDDTLRVGFFPPLTIYFAVSPEERLVRIVHVVAPQD